jgi:hypothetical protein
MKTKHTPGPWTFDPEQGEVTTPTRIQRSQSEIATVETGWKEPFESEQQANGVLIAAAPDLLIACEVSVYHLAAFLGMNNPAVVAMKDAITKAKGGAQ